MLSDNVLSSISGGYLPENWQEDVKKMIVEFKAFPDEQFHLVGYPRSAEGLIAFLKSENKSADLPASDKELATVADYIRSIY